MRATLSLKVANEHTKVRSEGRGALRLGAARGDRACSHRKFCKKVLPWLPTAEMLRKPAKDDPLPAFDRDDDESASTGEFRPLVHDVRALPSFSADDLPRFPSMVDPRERESGPTITKKPEPLPRFASMVDPHELERERVPASSRAPAPSRVPASSRAPASVRRVDALPRAPEADVAATLEKRPMTANAANRILAQLDRAPPRLDATGEIEIEDVLEEVYAEPAPRSKRSDAPPSSRGFAAENASRRAIESSRPSSMPSAMPSSMPPRAPESVAPRPFVPAPPPSFTGTDFPQPTRQNPPSFAPPLPAAAVSQSSPPAYPSSPPPSFAPPAQPPYLAPQGAAPYAPAQQQGLAYAATVPAGYVLVPQGSLMVPSSQAFAIGTTHDGSLVRPLPMAGAEEPRSSGILGKVLAGGLILGLSALAGGAASLWLVPEKAPDAVPSVAAPSVAVPPPVLPTASAPVVPVAPVAPSAVVPSSASVAQPSPSVMVPLGNGWPLAPATVPPGAASMAPPPPAERAAEKVVEPPPAPTGKLAEGMGRIVFAPNRMGHRVWIDGAMVGEPTGPLVVKCGKRNVRIGSGANGQSVDVPCGGEVVVK